MTENRCQKTEVRRQMTEENDWGFSRFRILDFGLGIDKRIVIDIISLNYHLSLNVP